MALSNAEENTVARERPSGRYSIRAVDRALDVLQTFIPDGRARTLPEIARLSNNNKATTHRIVRTLENRGFLDRLPDGSYRLGRTLATLGMVARYGGRLTELVEPILRQVVAETRETASCTILEGNEVLTVASVAGPHRLRYDVFPGERVPAPLVADGKVLLAELPVDDMLGRIAETDKKFHGSFGGQTLGPFMAELEEVQRAGVAVDALGRYERGIAAIAVPLRDHQRRVIAALVLTIPSARVNEQSITWMTDVLRRAARLPLAWNGDR